MTERKTKQVEKFNRVIEQLKNDSIETIVNYDVKEEWFRILYEGENNLSPWQKLCLYRLSSVGVDCDVSLRSVIIFALAFPHIIDTKSKISLQDKSSYNYRISLSESKEFIGEYRGDTMNSYATTTNEYLRLFGDDTDNPKVLNKKNMKFEAAPDYQKWEECILDNYEHFEQDQNFPKSGREFIRMYHTLGNFIPIPLGKPATAPTKNQPDRRAQFNVPRGSVSGKTKDYWDLALLYIYYWYEDNNDSHLENIVGAKENCELTKEWLKVFKNDANKPSWDMFIKMNYLQHFVEEGPNGVYGKPKELWDGHFDDPLRLPASKDEFEQFFDRSSEWIKARGERIAKTVKDGFKNDTAKKELGSMLKL